MGELEKNEYVDDRNEAALNGEEKKSPQEEKKTPEKLGLASNLESALKEKFKAEFVQV